MQGLSSRPESPTMADHPALPDQLISAGGSPESKGPSEIKETSKSEENRATMMELLLSASSAGDLQARLESVELGPGTVQMQPWHPGQSGGDSDVLIVLQRRGRPGDETSGRSQRVFVAVVPDEVSSSTDTGSGPGGLRLRSVVNIHVGPSQPRRATDTISEAAMRVVSDAASMLPWSVRQKRGKGVYVYSMLAKPGGLSNEQHQAVIESVMRNLRHRRIEVVYTFDQDKPPVLLLLCHVRDAEGTTPRNTLLQLGLPLTHSANTVLALVQEKGQTEEGGRPKIVGFTPGLKVLLTVEPPSYQLEKSDNNGKALREIERFSPPPFSLWKYFPTPIRRGISWQKL